MKINNKVAMIMSLFILTTISYALEIPNSDFEDPLNPTWNTINYLYDGTITHMDGIGVDGSKGIRLYSQWGTGGYKASTSAYLIPRTPLTEEFSDKYLCVKARGYLGTCSGDGWIKLTTSWNRSGSLIPEASATYKVIDKDVYKTFCVKSKTILNASQQYFVIYVLSETSCSNEQRELKIDLDDVGVFDIQPIDTTTTTTTIPSCESMGYSPIEINGKVCSLVETSGRLCYDCKDVVTTTSTTTTSTTLPDNGGGDSTFLYIIIVIVILAYGVSRKPKKKKR